MKLKGIAKKLMFILPAVLLASLCLLFFNAAAKNEAGDEGAVEIYTVGTRIKLQKINVNFENENITVSPVIHFPDGTAYIDENIVLSQPGLYTVEYKTIRNNKVYRQTKKLLVYDKLGSGTSSMDSCVYGRHESGLEGLLVKINYGSRFTYNKPINLNDLKEGEPFISFIPSPVNSGTYEAGVFEIFLTDAYDPENYIRINIMRSLDSQYNSYVKAGFNGTQLKGSEKGVDDGNLHVDGLYGYATKLSFYGVNYEKVFSMWFDLEEKTLHGNNNAWSGGSFIVNFGKNFAEPWKGFTTGEVILSITASSYTGSSANFIITKIGKEDLTQTHAIIKESTLLNIDWGDYSEDSYPDALLGKTYRVFDADYKGIFGNEKFEINVFYNYYTSFPVKVDIVNNRFATNYLGLYTIEYKLTDRFGNVNKKTVDVNCRATGPEVELEVEEEGRVTQGDVLTYIPVSKVKQAGGGLGRVYVDIKAKNLSAGEFYDVEDYAFKPPVPGEYEIIYKAYDYVNQTEEYSYRVNVGNGNTPVFEAEPVLPQFLIMDGEYTLPDVYASDYTSGSLKTIKASISVTDSRGIVNLSSNKYVPKIDGSYGITTITYKAVSPTTGQEATLSYEIPVINVNLKGQIDMSRYFVGESITASATNRSIDIKTDENQAFAQFINKLIADDFYLEFKISPDKNNFDKLNVYLTDSTNLSNTIKVQFVRNNNLCSVIVNDSIKEDLQIGFGDSDISIIVTYANNRLNVNGKKFELRKYLNGSEFDGFKSNYLYLKFEFEDVSGESLISVNEINGQILNNKRYDNIGPRLVITGGYGGQKTIGDEIIFYAAFAYDVLCPSSSVRLTVRMGQEVLTSIDGTPINNLDCSRDIKIKATKHGRIIVRYDMEDELGNPSQFTYVINVVDTVPPQISLSQTEISVKVGQTIRIPSATAIDNVTADLQLSMFLEKPNGSVKKIEPNSEVTFESNGIYKIKFMVFDEFDNLTVKECIVTVG